MEQQPITLQFLLEQASTHPCARDFWVKYVIPTHPEFELCNYWDDGAFVTLLLNNTDDESLFEICWSTGDRATSVVANDENEESAALHWPLVDEILQTVIFE